MKNWETEGVPVDDERWALIQRIVSSGHFVKAPQLREFLLYAASRYLANRPEEISEQQIGCSVLARREDFNPSQDNIVRVQARHLRKKLDDYFAGEGRDEPLVVSIPKGSYIPRFEQRAAQPETIDFIDAREALADLNGTATALPGHHATSHERAVPGKLTRIAVFALIPVALILAVVAWMEWRSSTGPRERATAATEPEQNDPLFAGLFTTARKTHIVIADTCLVMLQDLLNTDISIGDYVSHEYPNNLLRRASSPELRRALELISARQYTSLADANIASKLLQVGNRYTSETSIRYARHVNIRDFKTDNFILIGSRRGIPWVELFEDRLNFQARWNNEYSTFFFHNKAPRAGEQDEYKMIDQGNSREVYADIALLPNLSNSGSVLILNGITMEASEAAGEIIMSRDFRSQLEKIRAANDQPASPYFEVLIKSTAVAGAARDTKLVAYRSISAPATR